MEHASPEAIRNALKDAQIMDEEASEEISQQDLIDAGLIGGPVPRNEGKNLDLC